MSSYLDARLRREYLKDYQRGWVAKRRAEWMSGKTCAHCGCTEQLEVHHKDPTQKLTHNVWSWSSDRRDAELEKCIVLCRSCHKDETRAYRRSLIKHGTRTCYDVLRCRCEECRKAKSIHNNNYKISLHRGVV